jgi:hypothetical protein
VTACDALSLYEDEHLLSLPFTAQGLEKELALTDWWDFGRRAS